MQLHASSLSVSWWEKSQGWMDTKTSEKMFYALAQIPLFFFSSCPVLSAETLKTALVIKSQPPNLTELRNWIPQKTCLHIVGHLPWGTCKKIIKALALENTGLSSMNAVRLDRKCAAIYLLVEVFFPNFLHRVYKKKGKLITGTDERVTWKFHLYETSHICTPLW